MTATEEPPSAEQPIEAVDPTATPHAARPRQTDQGPEILPSMERFVTLVRKCKRPALVLALVERAGPCSLPALATLVAAAKGTLALAARRSLFEAVAALDAAHRQRIEHAAERVVLLGDDYGAQAVQSLLDEIDTGDAAVLAAPADRCSRALHLCLRQDFPEEGAPPEQRFEHAERLQVMHRQWKSEDYASHYVGPKGVVPRRLSEIEDVLRSRIAALFPQIAPEEVLLQQFTRRDLVQADRSDDLDSDATTPVLLHTLTATFNGSTAHFTQVTGDEEVEREEPAATSVCFSWESVTGALAVFSEDPEMRRPLAALFRDVVLACEGEIQAMPMRQFDLGAFSTPAILKRLEQQRVAGVEKISILQLRVARLFAQHITDEAHGRDLVQHLSSSLLIGRDRRDAARSMTSFARITTWRI
jgi:hypothetical protein